MILDIYSSYYEEKILTFIRKGDCKMEQNYKVIYNYTGVCNESIRELMASELMRVYNTYADMCNNGVTDRLNEEFKSQNPNYFEENKGKEWYDLTECNQFMADGYVSIG